MEITAIHWERKEHGVVISIQMNNVWYKLHETFCNTNFVVIKKIKLADIEPNEVLNGVTNDNKTT